MVTCFYTFSTGPAVNIENFCYFTAPAFPGPKIKKPETHQALHKTLSISAAARTLAWGKIVPQDAGT